MRMLQITCVLFFEREIIETEDCPVVINDAVDGYQDCVEIFPSFRV